MNGVHDMGGLQGFGAIDPDPREPIFHHPWERRVLGLTIAMGATRQWNLDQSRAARESIPPATYLSSSYYRIWVEGMARLMAERGLATAEELADGRMRTPPLAVNAIPGDKVRLALTTGSPTLRGSGGAARFAPGDAVRARNLNPPTHTRLPRYCRGKPGTIVRAHGVHVFADAHALGRDEAHWLYTVRFEAADLWGTDTTAAAVYVDCWEPYLEER